MWALWQQYTNILIEQNVWNSFYFSGCFSAKFSDHKVSQFKTLVCTTKYSISIQTVLQKNSQVDWPILWNCLCFRSIHTIAKNITSSSIGRFILGNVNLVTHYTIWMVYAHKSIARKQKIKLGYRHPARVLYNCTDTQTLLLAEKRTKCFSSTSKISRLVSQCITFIQSLNVKHFSSWLFLKNFVFLLKHI